MRPPARVPARSAPDDTRRSARAADRLGRRLRRLLGLRQSFTVEGVRYREVTTEPLRRALGRKGTGLKEYDVRFPDGATMRIRATNARHYADLVGDRHLELYQLAEPVLTPGSRVLALRSGTGRVGAWLSGRVGPSGAVVALDPDEESIAYAKHRYAVPNVAYEVGGVEAVAGEVDGAFDGVLAIGAVRRGPDELGQVRELWRLVAPAGWLVLAAPSPDDQEQTDPDPFGASAEELVALLKAACATPAEQGPDEDLANDPDDSTPGPARRAKPASEALAGILAQAVNGYAIVVAAKPGED